MVNVIFKTNVKAIRSKLILSKLSSLDTKSSFLSYSKTRVFPPLVVIPIFRHQRSTTEVLIINLENQKTTFTIALSYDMNNKTKSVLKLACHVVNKSLGYVLFGLYLLHVDKV